MQHSIAKEQVIREEQNDHAIHSKEEFGICLFMTALVTSHDSSELCDISNNGTSFPAHELVLAMRSEHFSTLFCQKQWHKIEEENRSIFESDFDAKVVEAMIKSCCCCKDDCDDVFSKSLNKLKCLFNDKNPDSSGRHQQLDEVMSEDEAISHTCHLVSLTMAVDCLMLTGLTRVLWKVACNIMRNCLPVLIPTIHDEATKHGSEELRQLAKDWFY